MRKGGWESKKGFQILKEIAHKFSKKEKWIIIWLDKKNLILGMKKLAIFEYKNENLN